MARLCVLPVLVGSVPPGDDVCGDDYPLPPLAEMPGHLPRVLYGGDGGAMFQGWC